MKCFVLVIDVKERLVQLRRHLDWMNELTDTEIGPMDETEVDIETLDGFSAEAFKKAAQIKLHNGNEDTVMALTKSSM